MSMWIFTPFDALFAEAIGRKFAGCLYSSPSPVSIFDEKKGKEVIRSPLAAKESGKSPEIEITARFAPEIDGVHCFEAILPY